MCTKCNGVIIRNVPCILAFFPIMYIVAAVGFEQELYTFTEPSGLTQQMETICVVMIGNLGRAIVLKSHCQEGSVTTLNVLFMSSLINICF